VFLRLFPTLNGYSPPGTFVAVEGTGAWGEKEIRVTDRLDPLNLKTLKADLAQMVEGSWLTEGRADTLRREFSSLRLRDHKGFSVRVFVDRGFL
jgi:hypothetical protein